MTKYTSLSILPQLVIFAGIWIGIILDSRRHSCADSLGFFSSSVPIVHHFWQVLYFASSVRIELIKFLQVGQHRSSFLCRSHLTFSKCVSLKSVRVVQLYGSTDTDTIWKNSQFILSWRSDLHIVVYQSITVHALPLCVSWHWDLSIQFT